MSDFLLRLFFRYPYQIQGYIIGVFLLFLISLKIIPNLTSGIENVYLKNLIIFLPYIIWTIVWYSLRVYVPRIKKNKIGIIIFINAENKKQKIRIKNDFAERLQKDFDDNNLSNLLEIIVLSDFKADRALKVLNDYTKANNDILELQKENQLPEKKPKEFKRWETFQKKIRGHYFVYGKIKERFDVENKYFISTEGLVIHRPIDLKTSDIVKKEFMKTFPKQLSFLEKFEYKGFEFSADTIYFNIRYITGIAALISGDVKIAIKLHEGLKSEVERFGSPLPPNLEHIKNNVDDILWHERYLSARFNYQYNQNIAEARNIVDECLKNKKNMYNAYILKSLIAFKEDRDVMEAIKALNLASKIAHHEFTWLYNKAFILMYIGKYRKAHLSYKKLSKLTFYGEEDIVNQCLDFNTHLLKNEPDKIQGYFIIGFLQWKKKGNLPEALEHFEKFLHSAKDTADLQYLYNASTSYLQSIKNEMHIK